MSIFNNISRRDRNLLLLLLVVVVYYLAFTFVITPARAESQELKARQVQIQNDITRAEELIGQEENLKQEFSTKMETVEEKYDTYLKSLNPSQILGKMDALMTEVNFSIRTYTPSEIFAQQVPVEIGAYEALKYPLLETAKQINEKIQEEPSQTAGESVETEGSQEDILASNDISFSFENASYESLYNFIESVENLNKTIQLKRINVDGNGGLLRGELTFSLFGLPPINGDRMIDYPLLPLTTKGKANPFS